MGGGKWGWGIGGGVEKDGIVLRGGVDVRGRWKKVGLILDWGVDGGWEMELRVVV